MTVGKGAVIVVTEGGGFTTGFTWRAVGGGVLECRCGVVVALQFIFAQFGWE